MASPLARGLFARAIGESGALLGPVGASSGLTNGLQDAEHAERTGVALARSLGARTIDELRRRTPQELLLAELPLGEDRWAFDAADAPFSRGALDGAFPTVDGWLLPAAPAHDLRRGRRGRRAAPHRFGRGRGQRHALHGRRRALRRRRARRIRRARGRVPGPVRRPRRRAGRTLERGGQRRSRVRMAELGVGAPAHRRRLADLVLPLQPRAAAPGRGRDRRAQPRRLPRRRDPVHLPPSRGATVAVADRATASCRR